MHMCIQIDPTTADPRRNADPCTSTLHFMLYEGLMRNTADGEGELALAESVDISDDGKIYTFHLRDASWSDGMPIVARDFEHSWKQILTPEFGSPCPYLLFPIKNAEPVNKGQLPLDAVGIQSIDDKTLRVELENPTPYFLSLITFCNFYPIPSHVESANPKWELSSPLVVSGPYRLVKWRHNQDLLLEKNPTYWDADHVSLDEIRLSVIPHDHTALQMFETGALDFVGTATSPIGIDDLSYCKKQNILKEAPLGGVTFCTFNLSRFPFQNRNIRLALSLAIDRDAITNNILQLSELSATRVIPPVLVRGQSRKLFPATDALRARDHLQKGLQELGVDRKQISDALILSYASDELHHQVAQTIQYQWKITLDLDATLEQSDLKSLITKHMLKNYAVGLDRILAQYNDPNNILERFKSKDAIKNLPGFENPEYTRLLDEATCAKSPHDRLQLLEQAEEILAAEMPIAPIFHMNQGILIRPQYDNVEFSPLGNILFKHLTVKQE